MEINKKSQITVIEITFLLLLIGSYFTYISLVNDSQDYDSSLLVNSMADSIYFDERFRIIIQDENLLSSSITQNWSELTLVLNNSLTNYSLIVRDSSNTKVIVSCNPIYSKDSAIRYVTISDQSNYDFRYFILEVCY